MSDSGIRSAGFCMEPIARIHSCYGEKFGIPRQPGLSPSARAQLEILPPFDREEAFRGIEQFSHLWILFLFHGNGPREFSPTVRPPRLGGNKRLGVFATRSPFRPNPLGLSVVRFEGLSRRGGRLMLEVGGGDFLDGTPVIDIKPYIPYADAPEGATGGFAEVQPEARLELEWSDEAMGVLEALPQPERERFMALAGETLRLDPRPAYIRDDRSFACALDGWDLQWRIEQERVRVLRLERLNGRLVSS